MGGVIVLAPNTTVLNSMDVVGAAGDADAAVSDNSDATYLATTNAAAGGSAHSEEFTLPVHTMAAGERVKHVRVVFRASAEPQEGGSGKLDKIAYLNTNTNEQSTEELIVVTGEPVSGSNIADRHGSYFTDLFRVPVASQQAVLDNLGVKFLASGDEKPKSTVLRLYEVDLHVHVWERTDAPTVSVNPAGPTITDSNIPTIEAYVSGSLNFGSPTSDNYSHEVKIFRDAVYLAGGFDPSTEQDVEFSYLKNTLPTPSTDSRTKDTAQPSEPLANNDTYRGYVRYGKNNVAGETLWSEWAFVEFTISVTLPTAPTLVATPEPSNARVELDLTTAALTHDSIEGVEVQRSADGGTTWQDVRHDIVPAPSTSYLFYDNEMPRGVSLLYRTRVIEGLSVGTTITSDWNTIGAITLDNDGEWWLKSPTNPDLNMIVQSEGTDLTGQFTIDSASFAPIGRTTYVTVKDKAKQREGSHTFGTIGTAEYNALKALWESMDTLFLQSPNEAVVPSQYVDVDNPVKDDIVNFVEPYHRVTIKFMPAEKP